MHQLGPATCNQPLNPRLYQLLQERLGSVILADEGAEMVYSTYPDPCRPGKWQVSVISPGEYYRTRCPFCADGRHRLWINHRFGTIDPNGYPIFWLAHCHHENCLAQPGRARQLAEWIFALRNRNDRPPPMSLHRGRREAGVLRAVQAPGEILSLADLPADHPACEYLRGRGFDPAALSGQYGVGYCAACADYWALQNRLYVPMFMQGFLVGWQGRLIGDYSRDELRGGAPKYFTLPGMPTGRILYGYDAAVQYPFVIVVEGVTDVWRVGPPAVALLGKSMSRMQQHLLLSGWREQPIFMLLDGDAQESCSDAIARLRTDSSCGPSVRVTLPDGRDPADLGHDRVWFEIGMGAYRQGIDLAALYGDVLRGASQPA